MVVRPGSSAGKDKSARSSVSPPVFVGVIIAACLVIGLIGYWLFAPHSTQLPPRQLSAAEQADNQWIKQKAKESGGEMSKLSMEDQRKLIMMKGEAGPAMLKEFAAQK